MAESLENPRAGTESRATPTVTPGRRRHRRRQRGRRALPERARGVAPPRSARCDRRLRRPFPLARRRERALVASADGVGTKMLIAARTAALRRRRTRPRQPLRQRHPRRATQRRSSFSIISPSANSIRRRRRDRARCAREACRAHDCALLGGETAEMPGLYARGHFDLAGTIVGVVDARRDSRSGAASCPAMRSSGCPSIGLHTNGYSLARALIPPAEWSAAVRRRHLW